MIFALETISAYRVPSLSAATFLAAKGADLEAAV